mmetsp:Transcript_21126/g.23585  ORF Transcript_21126/g.23585 Transcript_21126/m.23585 type:complete len:200 (-) Transcript_21126:975-1574(-)
MILISSLEPLVASSTSLVTLVSSKIIPIVVTSNITLSTTTRKSTTSLIISIVESTLILILLLKISVLLVVIRRIILVVEVSLSVAIVILSLTREQRLTTTAKRLIVSPLITLRTKVILHSSIEIISSLKIIIICRKVLSFSLIRRVYPTHSIIRLRSTLKASLYTNTEVWLYCSWVIKALEDRKERRKYLRVKTLLRLL